MEEQRTLPGSAFALKYVWVSVHYSAPSVLPRTSVIPFFSRNQSELNVDALELRFRVTHADLT